MDKKPTNKEKVLALLQAANGEYVTIGQFLAAGCGTRFGARIYELRQEGHMIDMKYFGKKGEGDFRYSMLAHAILKTLGESAAETVDKAYAKASMEEKDNPEHGLSHVQQTIFA